MFPTLHHDEYTYHFIFFTFAVRLLKTHTEYLVGFHNYSKHPSIVIANTPSCTSWVYQHPYFFHRSLRIPWLCSHPRRGACKKTILTREKVWVILHPQCTAREVSTSLTMWVCSHPRRTGRKVSSLKSRCVHTHDVRHERFPL